MTINISLQAIPWLSMTDQVLNLQPTFLQLFVEGGDKLVFRRRLRKIWGHGEYLNYNLISILYYT